MTMNDVAARHGKVVADVLLVAKAVTEADTALKLADPLTNKRASEEREEVLDDLHVAIATYESLYGPLHAVQRTRA